MVSVKSYLHRCSHQGRIPRPLHHRPRDTFSAGPRGGFPPLYDFDGLTQFTEESTASEAAPLIGRRATIPAQAQLLIDSSTREAVTCAVG